MGFISKIKEMFRKSRTLRLNEHNETKGTKNIGEIEFPYIVSMSNNQNIMVSSIQFDRNVIYDNGKQNSIVIAKIVPFNDFINFLNQKTVVFEIPQGMQIDDIMLQKIGYQYVYENENTANNLECMYLGELSSDLYRSNIVNKSDRVQKYVNERILPQVEKEKDEQIQKQMKSTEQIRKNNELKENEFKIRIQKEQQQYEQQERKIKSERIANPTLTQSGNEYIGNDGKKYIDYNGVNVYNGNILKLRKTNKVGKDENGTYLYTTYIQETPHEYDVEILGKNEIPNGIPVCFATDKKIEDVINFNNQNDLKTLLQLLGNPEIKKQNNGYLNYIGKIDKNNNIENKISDTSNTIRTTVENLQMKFYNQKSEKQREQREEH